jgi:hypothetical protein
MENLEKPQISQSKKIDFYDSDINNDISYADKNTNVSIEDRRVENIADYNTGHKYIARKEMDKVHNKYPYCIVWTPLPLISWFLPFIGHTGICT